MTHNIFEQNDFTLVGPDEIHIHDITRDPYPTPCPDCRREHLNGEHIVWNVPVKDSGERRVVWEGCVDCWVKRTNPVTP